MPRNPENYPLTLSIPRDSELYRALLADAKRTGTKQLAVLATTRLSEYYQWSEQGLISLLIKLLSGGRIDVKDAIEPSTNKTQTPASVQNSREMSLKEILDNCAEADDAFPD